MIKYTMRKVMNFLAIFSFHIILLSFVVSSNADRSLGFEELMIQLDLFPQTPIDIIDGSVTNVSEPVGPSIVEKRFMFPNLARSNGLSGRVLGHFAGYYKIKHSHASRMFYFFFESRTNNRKAPVIIWLTGGPGCGSELALFRENGPVIISDDLSLELNEYGWDKISNLLYVDQPIGTGFSYTSDKRDIRYSEIGVGHDLYDFLQAFFKEHPKLAKNDFYITGESYAGHYIPALATRILKGNKAKEGIHINLKGLAIGNGLTNPAIQFTSYPDYAYYMRLIDTFSWHEFKEEYSSCKTAIKTCGSHGHVMSCKTAFELCNVIFTNLVFNAGVLNVYDIRNQNTSFSSKKSGFSDVLEFLKQKSVRDALGVGDREFVPCNKKVYETMTVDILRNLEVGVPDLLHEGVKLLIYAGEYDLLCNWIGNLRWVMAMKWKHQRAFYHSPEIPFVVDETKAGIMKRHGPLTFIKVHNAGHNVPMDQPEVALVMLRRWIKSRHKAKPRKSPSNSTSMWSPEN